MASLDLELNSAAFIGGTGAINSAIGQLIAGSGQLDNALLSVSHALISFQQSGRQVKDIQQEIFMTTGKNVTVWQALGQTIKANPIMTIAAVLGIAATAMSVFAAKTSAAAEAQNQLNSAVKASNESLSRLGLIEGFGGTVSKTSVLETRAGVLLDTIQKLQSSRQSDTTSFLNSSGLLSLVGLGPTKRPELNLTNILNREVSKDEFAGLEAARGQGPEAVQSYVRALASEELKKIYAQIRDSQARDEQRQKQTPFFDLNGDFTKEYGDKLGLKPSGSAQLEQLQRDAEQLKQIGEDVGQTFANIFDRATQAGATLRGVLQGLAQDLRGIATSIIGSYLRNAVGNAFAATKTQEINNLPRPGGD